MVTKERILLELFSLHLTVLALFLLGTYLGWELTESAAVRFLLLVLPLFLVILHAVFTLSLGRGLFFLLLACLVGLTFEILGLSFGSLVGVHYIYKPERLMVLGVPLSVAVYWSVFTYTAYSFVNSFLFWLGKEKPDLKRQSFFVPLLLVIFDGLTVVSIDLFMDPLQMRQGRWIWLSSGPYFGVPIGNFIGWMAVSLATTGPFRLIEYLRPKRLSGISKTVFIYPVFGYGFLWLSFLFLAINLRMINLAVFGTSLMLPPTILNVFFFLRMRKARSGGSEV